MNGETLEWKVHTVELFKEILANPECDMLKIPLNILKNLLAQVAQRASELHDPELDKLMIRLTLYSIADPNDPDYDSEAVAKILETETSCGCNTLQRTMATNWSYYKCVKCGVAYFTAGKAEVLDFSEADKRYLLSLKSGGKITTEAERKAEELKA